MFCVKIISYWLNEKLVIETEISANIGNRKKWWTFSSKIVIFTCLNKHLNTFLIKFLSDFYLFIPSSKNFKIWMSIWISWNEFDSFIYLFIIFWRRKIGTNTYACTNRKYLISKTCIYKVLKFSVSNFCYKTIWNASYVDFFFYSTYK